MKLYAIIMTIYAAVLSIFIVPVLVNPVDTARKIVLTDLKHAQEFQQKLALVQPASSDFITAMGQ